MSNKTKKTKKEDADNELKFRVDEVRTVRVNAVRTVMTMSLKRGFRAGKKHFPKLDKYEFVAGLLMAVIDATISILGIDRTIPRSLVIGMVINMLEGLKEALEDE